MSHLRSRREERESDRYLSYIRGLGGDSDIDGPQSLTRHRRLHEDPEGLRNSPSGVLSRPRSEREESNFVRPPLNLSKKEESGSNEMANAKSKKDDCDSDSTIFRVPPYHFMHVLDQTTNVSRVELGPQTFIRKENERVVRGPEHMVVVLPRHYCVIRNPVMRDKDGNVVKDKYGQVRILHGEEEVRLHQEAFPLHPGENVEVKVTPLKVVVANTALRLEAIGDFEENGTKRVAGDQWLFEGPGTYIPRKEVRVSTTVTATVLHHNEALKLKARKETIDRDGHARVSGEQWLVRRTGAYLPGAHEEVVEVVKSTVLTDKTALHIQALGSYTDQLGVSRRTGEEWLVTLKDTESYIPEVYETIVSVVDITTLTNRQYCVVCNPVGTDGKPQLGKRKLLKGEASFFLLPGEYLENGIQDIYVLGDNEGLILRANETFKDTFVDPPVNRSPGDRWMITGPVEFVPPVEMEVVTQRSAIPLHENEGIYVRNIKTGKVRAVIGHTYMLNQDEELWSKKLPAQIRQLLSLDHDALADRSSMLHAKRAVVDEPPTDSRVVTYQVPHNAAVQIYDYRSKEARVVFGPDLVMLGPDEQFTQLSLSGGRPKKPNTIRALCLLLGPDFCTDVIAVETADHARLSLQLAYNWYFDTADRSAEGSSRLFSVPDFVGDACKAIASLIRGSVAGVQFDHFHKNSADIIRRSVFGLGADGNPKSELKFPQNNLVVTSVDIQSVEPIDQRTRDSLQKSVQLAIEITTDSLEATARHEAQRAEQEARGRLERQKIQDAAEAEAAKHRLLQLQSESAALESTGQAEAESHSRAKAARIEGESAVELAKLKAQACATEAECELERLRLAREAEISFQKEQNLLEIERSRELANIEVERFKKMVDAVGSDTLKAMSTAGGDQQVRLLQSLGLQSTLITDGRTPINLLNTAAGLLGQLPSGGGAASGDR